jgi:hypothetical protein
MFRNEDTQGWSMIMKSRIHSACLIAMVLLAPAAFGEIVYDDDCGGCGGPGGASPYALANGGNPFVDSYGWGEMSYYTTTPLTNGHCYYYVSAWAEAHVRCADDGSCIAAAAGYADGDGPDGSIHASADASCSGPPSNDDSSPGTDADEGVADGPLPAWTSTSTSYSAEACAVVDEGSAQMANANAYIVAWCTLSSR